MSFVKIGLAAIILYFGLKWISARNFHTSWQIWVESRT